MGIPRAIKLLPLALAAGALAGEPGFVEEFTGGLGGWAGGATETIVSSGGVGGAGDPYMLVANAIVSQVAVRNMSAPYTGDLPANGVTGLSLFLRDLGGTEEQHIRIGVGTMANFWISAAQIDPGADEWVKFEVDFTDPGAWTQYFGAGTLADALATCDRILIRHFHQIGDDVPTDGVGEFGVDRITILPAAVPPCNAADLGEPFGTLDFSDVLAFLSAFGVMDGAADLADPVGVFDFSDVLAFLVAFGAGCP